MFMRKFRINLLVFLIFIFFLGILIFHYLLPYYYHYKAGSVLSTLNGNDNWISCESLHTEKFEDERVKEAIRYLETSLQYNTDLSHTYLQLGRANCLLGLPSEALTYFQKYINIRPNNPMGYIESVAAIEMLCGENGIYDFSETLNGSQSRKINIYPCNDTELNLMYDSSMAKAEITADNILRIAEFAYEEKLFSEAFNLYKRILYIDQDHKTAWLMIGKLCQMEDYKDEICEFFLRINDNNLFVDHSFTYERLFNMWPPYEYTYDTKYGVTECPYLEKEQCVEITILENPPTNGAGLYQCIYLNEDRKYRYSVWVNSEANDWYPLYYQGDIDGNLVGHRYNMKEIEYSGGWSRFVMEFTANKYDGKVCFHPIRLMGNGRIWFYNPRLELISP